jgi:hypothetical protein
MLCDNCGRTILDFGYEPYYLVVKEGQTPDTAKIECEDCHHND